MGTEKATTHLDCWTHARRKFIEAQKVAGGSEKKVNKGKQKSPSKADIALNYIGHLYGIERKGKLLTTEERHRLRQTESLPVLEKLRS